MSRSEKQYLHRRFTVNNMRIYYFYAAATVYDDVSRRAGPSVRVAAGVIEVTLWPMYILARPCCNCDPKGRESNLAYRIFLL